MLIVDRIQQLIMLVLVACSGWLLGIGQQNPVNSALAVSAAVLSFILNDWLQVVRLGRWVANVVALLVTAVALRGFFRAESADQLLMIASLLIYLQIVLLFQIKTPRVYWQILVLSLLQIVVAAAFNIRLEGGIVFFLYLLVSAVAMVILQVHSQTHQIRIANRRTVNAIRDGKALDIGRAVPLIVAMHDQVYPNRRPLKAMIRQVFALGIVAIGFAVITFYLIPRDEITWTGRQLTGLEMPGFSRRMDLEEDVQIYLSNEVVMDVTFYDSLMNRRIELPDQPYLRGMPFTNVNIKFNQTRWETPVELTNLASRNPLRGLWTNDYVVQSIKVKPTSDPLLHTVLPAMRLPQTPPELDWNMQLPLLSRGEGFQNAIDSEFQYDLAIPIGRNLEPLESFPYLDQRANSVQRLDNNPEELARYTYIQSNRYPGLVQIAEEQTAKVANRDDTIAICRALTDYLAANGGYSYTLDFRNFNWDPKLDHIEDFVVNKRRGHCEFFASALVLMLRSQEIPARVVVGFHGGDFDRESQSYIVRKKNAHAWVEAYIKPENCPETWLRNGQAGRAGAWLRLDPTPASASLVTNATTPLAAAQDFWNTYVMGLNSAKQRDSTFQSLVRNPFQIVPKLFSIRYWEMQWSTFRTKGQWYKSAIFYVLIIVAVIVVTVVTNKLLLSRGRAGRPTRPVTSSLSFKRILGRTLAIVAPRLGRWMAGEDVATRDIAFFQRFLRILQSHGLERFSFQTAREFGRVAAQFFAQHDQSTAIRQSIESVVDKFYWVRFSQRELTADDLQQVEASLEFFEKNLTPPGMAT